MSALRWGLRQQADRWLVGYVIRGEFVVMVDCGSFSLALEALELGQEGLL